VADFGTLHVYIKPRPHRLNGNVELSHLTGDYKFYQLLKYTDDVDLNKKIKIATMGIFLFISLQSILDISIFSQITTISIQKFLSFFNIASWETK
jgi:hypothetical protein